MIFRLHSRRYFKRILLWTTIILLGLSFAFTLFQGFQAVRAYKESIFKTESMRAEDILIRINSQWDEMESIASNIASINIPSRELTIGKNYWALEIWKRLASSHTGDGGYIQNIETVIDQQTLGPTTLPHDLTLGKIGYFSILTSRDASWPYYFDLKTDFTQNKLNNVTITVSSYHLGQRVFSSTDRSHQDYLLSPDKTVILSNERSVAFKNINEIFPDILMTPGIGTTLASYKDYYVSSSSADSYGFCILSLVPKSYYAQQRRSALIQTAFTACALIPIALLISYVLSKRFYDPIKALVKLLRTYVQDDINEYEDEIIFIQHSLSNYISKEVATDKLLSDTIQKLQNAQSAVLQHQINHHFLFNTLENIKAISVSELGIGNEVEESIILLNNIIYEGIFQKNAFVSLSQELVLTKSYLSLMKMRFPGVSVEWSVNDALMDCTVFKFSLQPILENCFLHAFSETGQYDKRIKIQITQSESLLIIRVSDNGRGLDADSLQKINQALNDTETTDGPIHVGMKNVHQRIIGVFGNQYGIKVSGSAPGITVQIRYPVVYMNKNASEPDGFFSEVNAT